MQPDTWDFHSPRVWLQFARSDLNLARQHLDAGVLYETLCFLAQQSVEKSLKAVSLHLGVKPARTHVIEALFDLIATKIEVPSHLRTAANLTPYATATRYPDEFEPLSEEHYRHALQSAEAVFDWAEKLCPH